MLNRNGFTLIELMIVVVIMGILAAIAIPNFISMQDRAKEADVRSNAHVVQLAVEDYAVRHDGGYPSKVSNFISLLPEGILLENSFNQQLIEPEDAYSNRPVDPRQGGIYYFPSSRQGGSYTILAYGKYIGNGPIAEFTSD